MPDVFFCEITDNLLIADSVYSITVACREPASLSAPGQFFHIKCGEARLLRRPVSICRVNGDKLNFVFEVKGEGTRWLADRRSGQRLNILGPLGNGYIMPKDRLIVVGGGVGTPPLLFAAQSADNTVAAVLGFRSADRVILVDEFKAACSEVIVTTDDGSAGIHGAVTKPLEELLKKGRYKAVISCGQLLMQKAVAELCMKYDIPCHVSLEERMGCGVGACLVCACAVIGDNGKEMSRACVDGPVYESKVVDW